MREMKDSGVEWIGEIPSAWDVARIKQISSKLTDGTHGTYERVNIGKYLLSAKNVFEDGIRIGDNESLISEDDFRSITSNGFPQRDDVLLCCVGTVGRCTIYEYDEPIAFQRSVIFIRCNEKMLPRYLKYSLQSPSTLYQERLYINKSAQEGIYQGAVKELVITCPKICEQQKIVDFLDNKCAKIDSIIEKQQAIIEKLKKYKLSVITEAVTKGLNSDVELKDSGSIWFGNIPVNWEMKRLKYVFHIQKDIAGEEGHTVLSITQRGIVPKDFSNNEGQFANSYANYQLVHIGDFAMNHMDLLTGWVDISKYEGVTSPDYRVFVLDDKNNNCPDYYLYLMQMCYSQKIFYGLGAGVSGLGRWRLQADKFLNFLIPIPPKSEQESIARFLDKQIENVEKSIEKRITIIDKLQDYKKSLIYEVITGKKEV